MALASTTWDDYSGSRAGLSPSARRNLNSALAAFVAAAACLAAAVPILHELEHRGLIAPIAAPARVMPAPSRPLSHPHRSVFERSADSFLRDSLLLTQGCTPGCVAITADIAEAKTIGRFVTSGSLPTGLPLEPHFTLPAAPDPAITATSPAPLPLPLPLPPATPAPIRVSPSVIVPLSPAAFDDAEAPVPAPRLARSTETLAAPAAMADRMEQASLPAPAHITSPSQVPDLGDGTAIYDISAATVYLPNGERLEAHSGLGYMVDDPRYVNRRNIGPTPPNTYNLVGLNDLFYGVEALRLVPVDGSKMYGRDGFLTHTYLLRGHPAQSNGCVAFKDYARFLAAYKRGYVKRLVVVPSLKNSPMRVASADEGKLGSLAD